MRRFWILTVMGLLAVSARAQSVYEASLLLGGSGDAVLWSGKFWLQVDAQGKGQFQTAVTSLGAARAVIAAWIEVPGAVVDFTLGQGVARTYSGCNLLGPNPFLDLPSDPGEIVCDVAIAATFYQGQFHVAPEAGAQLAAQQGVVHLRLSAPGGGDPFKGAEITGALQVTGATLNRQYFLVSPGAARLTPAGDALRLIWPAQPGGQYLVQLKSEVTQVAWQNNGPPFAATNTLQTLDIPLISNAKSVFYRILVLR